MAPDSVTESDDQIYPQGWTYHFPAALGLGTVRAIEAAISGGLWVTSGGLWVTSAGMGNPVWLNTWSSLEGRQWSR